MDIGVVLVTYNRLELLKQTLAQYEKQTSMPSFILVADNCSTDGTAAFLREWEKEDSKTQHRVLYLPKNIGGSGGFYSGMKEALGLPCDWVFVADDDAVPRADTLEKLVAFQEAHPDLMEDTAVLCTSVYNRDHFSGIHRCRLHKSVLGYLEAFVPEKDYREEYFELDIYSFVGTMIRKRVLEEAGPARKDFFIYNDDYEHACRVRKYGKMICVPAAVMDHTDNLNYSREATWRDYYATRNAVIMHRIHFGKYAGFMRGMRRMLVALSTRNPEKWKVIRTGIRDAYAGKTGVHEVYKPGWKAGRTYGL